LRRALESAGIRFIDEDELDRPGVRLEKGMPAGKRNGGANWRVQA
jgi:hypothetical protein